MINLKMIGYVILVALFVIPGCNIYTKSKSESSVGPKRIVQDVYAQDSKRIQIMGEYTYIYGDNMDLFEAKEICYTLALRNAIERGVAMGPRIFTAGKALGSTGGHAAAYLLFTSSPLRHWRIFSTLPSSL